MKHLIILLLSLLAVTPAAGQAQRVPLADPFILLYGDTYYGYGTSADNGIAVYTSQDLLTWKYAGLALHSDDSYGNRWFWAPEVHQLNGRFYLFYSANEHTCVATADHPLGPFRHAVLEPMVKGESTIDNTLFVDDNGRAYIYYDRFNEGLNVWGAEVNPADMTILEKTQTACIRLSQAWERVWPTVNEGAFVIKHNGAYYMTYSANSYESPLYGVGYATAKHPLGPWTKYADNPILQSPGELVGVGHSSMFRDKAGQLRIVFHAHHSKDAIHPREMYISTVSFERRNGQEIMVISPDYLTPHLTP